MKIKISVPAVLNPQHSGMFRIDQQESASTESVRWQNVVSVSGLVGGDYLADLEPGFYQKSIGDEGGLPTFSTTFEITSEGNYVDAEGNIFQVDEEGNISE
ncbi:hypothetical protein KDA_41320 [Dictyobacter alpinus]|uniref:Uncharacterized protein n=1 Tax=Dictyobacter alpinus TaxID=2014873 RepID=A0A402BB38_9CHLR|nr:hypothetical protein [Dictyobacter alpinus]GCE28648.1 hypothetical protein KDA_41320 [Dictyobacter alpinus]